MNIGRVLHMLGKGFNAAKAVRLEHPELAIDGQASELLVALEGWSPEINGQPLLDEPTRQAGARFLVGLAAGLERAQA